MEEKPVKKSDILGVALISGLLAAMLREIFLQQYEQQYRFLISVIMTIFISLSIIIMIPFLNKLNEISKKVYHNKWVSGCIGGLSGMLTVILVRHLFLKKYCEQSELFGYVSLAVFITIIMMIFTIIYKLIFLREEKED